VAKASSNKWLYTAGFVTIAAAAAGATAYTLLKKPAASSGTSNATPPTNATQPDFGISLTRLYNQAFNTTIPDTPEGWNTLLQQAQAKPNTPVSVAGYLCDVNHVNASCTPQEVTGGNSLLAASVTAVYVGDPNLANLTVATQCLGTPQTGPALFNATLFDSAGASPAGGALHTLVNVAPACTNYTASLFAQPKSGAAIAADVINSVTLWGYNDAKQAVGYMTGFNTQGHNDTRFYNGVVGRVDTNNFFI
jgi:hypothetical protein